MRYYFVIAATSVLISACAVDESSQYPTQLTQAEVTSMSKATQEKYCAVLTEVVPDKSKEYDGSVTNQLVEVRSDVITDISSRPINAVSAHRESLLSPDSAPRGWKLSAPCIVWRSALESGPTLPTRVAEVAGRIE